MAKVALNRFAIWRETAQFGLHARVPKNAVAVSISVSRFNNLSASQLNTRKTVRTVFC